MGLRLLLYLSLLIIGGIIGSRDCISERFHSKLGTIQNVCLLFLLFIMGVRIGLDEDVISSFLSIGVKAFVLALFSIIFSVLLVRLVRNIVLGNKEENVK